ncbi:hypothetical protein ACIQBJ_08890 [Kitasatospora sp. NPDC088391]|uniref:hypothetical protein n=1 Tax=Kitasatospora sp. NPDC088391 TaxID=3364074 RepID=UPI0037FD8DEF
MNHDSVRSGVPLPFFVVCVALLMGLSLAGFGYLFARRDRLSRSAAVAWAAGCFSGTVYLLFRAAEVLHAV